MFSRRFHVHSSAWLVLLVVTMSTQAQTPQNSPIPDKIQSVWKGAGAIVGWLGWDRTGTLKFQESKEGLQEALPAFRFRDWNAAKAKELPDPGIPFGLDLNYTQVRDVGLKELAGLKNLILLDLSDTQVTDAGLKELAGLKNLTKLYLSDTEVTDAGLKELVGLKNLTELSLSFTKVTDVGLKELTGLKKLTRLYLRRTQVTDEGVKELQKALPDCRIHTGP